MFGVILLACRLAIAHALLVFIVTLELFDGIRAARAAGPTSRSW
jgi:hypothetical protein